jgi:hypothetical protein
MGLNPFSWANWMAFFAETRIDRFDALQSILIPSTWMMPLNGSLPAEVKTSPPSLPYELLRRDQFPSTLDGSANALGQQQPPRDDVAAPGVDNHFHILIEQIDFDNLDDGGAHNAYGVGTPRRKLRNHRVVVDHFHSNAIPRPSLKFALTTAIRRTRRATGLVCTASS